MSEKFLFKICLFALIIINLSFTWPMKNERITSSFGESRWDHFHTGIDIISGNTAAHPVDDGELVFFWDNSLFPTENYPGGGNYKVLEHDGYYSVYMHLSDSPVYKTRYALDEPVGTIGSTGHSLGIHLHLSMYDIKEKKFINPFSVFPKIEDPMPPVIENAYIRIEDKYFRIKNNDNIRLTRHYPLLINIWDLIRKGDRLGIYRLIVELNGEKVVDNNYSEIAMSNKGLSISGKNYDDLFDEKGYYKAANIRYVEGINTISVSAYDYTGNEASKIISFYVDLDM